MSLMVNRPHPFGTDVCIKLSRAQIRMTEQFLYAPEIRSGIQKMCRKRMPQLMRGHFRRKVCCYKILLEIPLEGTVRKSGSLLIEENRRFRTVIGKHGSPDHQIIS